LLTEKEPGTQCGPQSGQDVYEKTKFLAHAGNKTTILRSSNP